MDVGNFDSAPRLFYSALVAMILHLLVLVGINRIVPEIPQRKTIPIKLVYTAHSSHKTEAKPRSKPKQQTSPAQQALTTTSESKFQQQPKSEQKRSRTSKSRKSTSKPSLLDLPERPKSRAESNTRKILSLFKNVPPSKEQRAQVSTKPMKNLTAYEQALLQHLISKPLYSADQYYEKVRDSLKSEPNLVLKIQLKSNGLIRRVTIQKPSVDPLFNEMWKANAINASPYPKPPSQDKEKDFSYLIPIIFERRAQ